MWVSLIPVVLTFGVFAFVLWFLKRGYVGKTGPIVMLHDEVRVAEIFALCKDIKYGGVVFAGNVHDGKLILTNRRLIHTNTNGQRVGLVLLRDQIIQIAKGKDGPLMTLELDYQTPRMKAAKHSQFLQVTSGSGIDPRHELPIGMFIDKLLAWKQVA
jgi:hypothetical protein